MPTKIDAVASNGNEKTDKAAGLVEPEAQVSDQHAATETPAATESAPPAVTKKPPEHWFTSLRNAQIQDIRERLSREIVEILDKYRKCLLPRSY